MVTLHNNSQTSDENEYHGSVQDAYNCFMFILIEWDKITNHHYSKHAKCLNFTF